MLQPAYTLPEFARTAAPTRKSENGACAFSRACFAAEIKASYSPMFDPSDAGQKSQPRSSVFLRSNSRQNRSKKRDELAFHTFARRQNFGMIERTVHNSG